MVHEANTMTKFKTPHILAAVAAIAISGAALVYGQGGKVVGTPSTAPPMTVTSPFDVTPEVVGSPCSTPSKLHDSWIDQSLFGCGPTALTWNPKFPFINVVQAVGVSAKSFQLTNAQLESMFTTPITVVPAGLSNVAYLPVDVVFQMNPGTTAFTGGGTVNFVYHGGSVPAAGGTIAASVVNATANSAKTFTRMGSNATTSVALTAGAGIDITNSTEVFATGNGTAAVTVYYRQYVTQ
jgi:hypothetical protein